MEGGGRGRRSFCAFLRLSLPMLLLTKYCCNPLLVNCSNLDILSCIAREARISIKTRFSYSLFSLSRVSHPSTSLPLLMHIETKHNNVSDQMGKERSRRGD
jgi:aminopeptidase-like protein